MTTPDANGWLPIESAPKDGTPILGFKGNLPEPICIGIVRWMPDNSRIADTWAGGALGASMFYPTHWQPLPNPPVSEPSL